jgi:hypothetical protein
MPGGESLSWDTSDGRWYRGETGKSYLITLIDGETSRGWARLATCNSPLENLHLLESYIRRFGRPLKCVFGRGSICCPKKKKPEASVWEGPHHVTRALESLGIEWAVARARRTGAAEVFFKAAHTELIAALAKAGIHEAARANRYLEDVYLPAWNRRVGGTAVESDDRHRPMPGEYDLADVLCLKLERIVGEKLKIRIAGVFYLIETQEPERRLRNARVEVLRNQDGGLSVKWNNRLLPLHPPGSVVPGRMSVPRRPSGWMRNFNLRDSPPLYRILKESVTG